MHKRSPALYGLLMLTGLLSSSCLSDDIDDETTRTTTSGLDADTDLVGSTDPGPCPSYEPKIGEACSATIGDQTRCSYVVDKCYNGSSAYDVVTDYCCFMGSFSQCGTSEPPCTPDAGDPTPVTPVDAPVSNPGAPDAGTDALDASPDA